MNRSHFYMLLSIVLIAGSLVFFYKCIRELDDRDYVGAILVAFVGFAVIRVGSEAMRLALVQKE